MNIVFEHCASNHTRAPGSGSSGVEIQTAAAGNIAAIPAPVNLPPGVGNARRV
jgi:hypothetical protein